MISNKKEFLESAVQLFDENSRIMTLGPDWTMIQEKRELTMEEVRANLHRRRVNEIVAAIRGLIDG